MATKLEPNIVGNIGVFYTCYRLSKLGWNVMPTTRNAKGIDIVAYSPDASHFIGVQVKSFSKAPAIPLGKTLDQMIGDWWVIVNNSISESPSVFVMRPDEVRSRAVRNNKDGQVSYWLDRRAYKQDQFREKWPSWELAHP